MKSRLFALALVFAALAPAAYVYLSAAPNTSAMPGNGSQAIPVPVASPARGTVPSTPSFSQDLNGADQAPVIEQKYRYLLSDWRGSAEERDRLLQLLREREHLVQMSNASGVEMESPEARLAAIDDELRRLLPPAEYHAYESLKASDSEQRHLADYTAGAGNVAPLRAEQERALLEAKLRHKQRYDALVSESGLYREGRLSAAERAQVRALIEQALSEYKDNYLREARLHLPDDEQYALLNNYETTEFERERERLYFMLDSKSGG